MPRPPMPDRPERAETVPHIIVNHRGVQFNLMPTSDRFYGMIYRVQSAIGTEPKDWDFVTGQYHADRNSGFSVNKSPWQYDLGSHSMAICIGIQRVHRPTWMRTCELWYADQSDAYERHRSILRQVS